MLERCLGCAKRRLIVYSLATAGMVLLVTACSTSYQAAHKAPPPPAKVAGQAQKPLGADQSSVTVIPNPYEDDQYQANMAVEATKQVLRGRGYNVVENGATAELVAIPTLETNRVQVLRRSTSPSDMFQEFDRPGKLFGTYPSLPTLAAGSTTAVNSKTNGSTLVIEAFRSDDWSKALIVNMLQLPPTWKEVTPLPHGYSTDPLDLQRTGGTKTQFQLPPDHLLTNAANH